MTDSGRDVKNVRDRRFQRTREDLLDAFRDLILSRRYDDFTVGDIVERANVGRSTFYEHYENKDDLLRHSMAPIVTALASALQSGTASDKLRPIVAHIFQNRRFSTSLLATDSRRLVVQFVADAIEEHLRQRHGSAALPLTLVAKTIAEAQIGLLVAWLSEDGSSSTTAERVTAALVAASRGIEVTILAP